MLPAVPHKPPPHTHLIKSNCESSERQSRSAGLDDTNLSKNAFNSCLLKKKDLVQKSSGPDLNPGISKDSRKHDVTHERSPAGTEAVTVKSFFILNDWKNSRSITGAWEQHGKHGDCLRDHTKIQFHII